MAPFDPMQLGYKMYDQHHSHLYSRIFDNKEYRLNVRYLEEAYWYELEVFHFSGGQSYYSKSSQLVKLYCVEDYYEHFIHKLPSSEEGYRLQLQKEYRLLKISKIYVVN